RCCLSEPPQQPQHCWVCFATERDDPRAQWLSPCRCRGSTKWVHLSCLQYWLDTRLRMSQRASPLLLLSGLPSIPVLLVLGKTVRWNDYIMKLWRKHWYEPQLPPGNSRYLPPIPVDEPRVQPQFLTSRNLCGALMFPSIAVLTGRLLFPSLTSHLQRALLGGGAYVLLKGVLKVYFKQQLFIMHAGRRILNYSLTATGADSDGRSELALHREGLQTSEI
uniref:E3 ubiquitin-protein ligase MARCHF5 n=1 Tax=Amphilophus citrinellus TaxID=61819 RepID=A0A3Q0RKF0_AMPCI